ncbi:DUF1294 domain-containing protein [Aquibacillus sp. 3ASR75-11]|uniref:DUF1294 domain-containing protein n=1 Tax=Terrihalobacillus insolitus TaxID=2950438 RepID=A0A9X3WTH2_9BACI|nr:DUF1294 domain-containing protein [Terrihalobacillus insolitus]MDC3412600.1 DUF1294 domain-containing protein [Terrihalobacillus insolitus]MDC3423951.1 DUF1294 domain-containing protein [Terrihalobacillus insolitus]
MDEIILIITYFGIINITAFFTMGVDKRRSKSKHWRIPERRLWLLTLFGGAIGAYYGMRTFRHKTKHLQFKYGLPIVALLQVILYVYLFLS